MSSPLLDRSFQLARPIASSPGVPTAGGPEPEGEAGQTDATDLESSSLAHVTTGATNGGTYLINGLIELHRRIAG